MSWLEWFQKGREGLKGEKACSWRALQRSASEEKAYRQWVDQKIYLNWTPCIFKSYHYQKCRITPAFRLQILQDLHKQGVVLFYDPQIGPKNFRHLFEFIKDQSLGLGYTHHLSDQRVITHERYTETIDKHYLKPPALDHPHTGLCNQLYGNIMVDLVSINGQPGFIRFYVNTFADSHFSRPLPFDELMERVFNTEA